MIANECVELKMDSFFNVSYCNMVSEVEYEPTPEYCYSCLITINFNSA